MSKGGRDLSQTGAGLSARFAAHDLRQGDQTWFAGSGSTRRRPWSGARSPASSSSRSGQKRCRLRSPPSRRSGGLCSPLRSGRACAKANFLGCSRPTSILPRAPSLSVTLRQRDDQRRARRRDPHRRAPLCRTWRRRPPRPRPSTSYPLRTVRGPTKRTCSKCSAARSVVRGYDFICRRKGRGHRESNTLLTEKRCPKCSMRLWPKALPRPLGIHNLRGTTGTLLARAGAPLVVAQRSLRHSDPRLTANVYTRVDIGDLRDGINRIAVRWTAWHRLTELRRLSPPCRQVVDPENDGCKSSKKPSKLAAFGVVDETGFEPATPWSRTGSGQLRQPRTAWHHLASPRHHCGSGSSASTEWKA